MIPDSYQWLLVGTFYYLWKSLLHAEVRPEATKVKVKRWSEDNGESGKVKYWRKMHSGMLKFILRQQKWKWTQRWNWRRKWKSKVRYTQACWKWNSSWDWLLVKVKNWSEQKLMILLNALSLINFLEISMTKGWIKWWVLMMMSCLNLELSDVVAVLLPLLSQGCHLSWAYLL